MEVQQPSTRIRKISLEVPVILKLHACLHQGKGNNVKTNNHSLFKLGALCALGLHKLLIRSVNYILSVYKGDFLLQQSKNATWKKKLNVRK